jgi:hypothetical protein
MIAFRSASLMFGQAAISAMVRPQPTQIRVAGSRRQTATQGLAVMPPILPDAVPAARADCRDRPPTG